MNEGRLNEIKARREAMPSNWIEIDEVIEFAEYARQDIPDLLAEIDRLHDIEARALEQSQYVQEKWLSPVEAVGLREQVERLQTELAIERSKNGSLLFDMAEAASTIARMDAALAEFPDPMDWYPGERWFAIDGDKFDGKKPWQFAQAARDGDK